ncbi:MAG: hypothetical protein KGJ93_03155 [Patescibacteria group bacterium]|nr:hypothetical protein [Patescibacteria group bacterium]
MKQNGGEFWNRPTKGIRPEKKQSIHHTGVHFVGKPQTEQRGAATENGARTPLEKNNRHNPYNLLEAILLRAIGSEPQGLPATLNEGKLARQLNHIDNLSVVEKLDELIQNEMVERQAGNLRLTERGRAALKKHNE